MSHAQLSDLPLELGEQIVSGLEAPEIRSLRATCRPLSAAATTQFYATFTLNASKDFKTLEGSLLEDIADGRSQWAEYADTFVITADRPMYWGSFDCFHATHEGEEFFRKTLPLFRKVRSLIFHVSRFREVQWLPKVLCESLATSVFPLLESLEVAFPGGFHLDQEKRDPALAKLGDLQAPNLHTLKIFSAVWGHAVPSSTIVDIIRRSPLLKILHLHGHMQRSFASIWETLRTENIALTELSTNALSPSLVDYLASYSGLRSLVVSEIGTEEEEDKRNYYLEDINNADITAAARVFFANALPKHASSLEEMTVLTQTRSARAWSVYDKGGCGWDGLSPADMPVLTRVCAEVNPNAVVADTHGEFKWAPMYVPQFIARVNELLPMFPVLEELEIQLAIRHTVCTSSSYESERTERDDAMRNELVKLAEDLRMSVVQPWSVSVREREVGFQKKIHKSLLFRKEDSK
ncbi:F-box domain-containing protein [Mycena kentingensis (nom. inval.)]|nr:F-box domain-containing protein [Mycena kentingensis (nom. inval.)]